MLARCARFRPDNRGSVITFFAFSLPVLAVVMVAASELAEVETAKTELQQAVDSAALKGAQELQLDQSSATTTRAQLMADQLANPLRTRWSVQTTAQADISAASMTVTQNATRGSLFGSLLPPGGFNLSATATARSNLSTPLCVLALQAGSTQILSVQNSSQLTASGCLVQSDSDLAVGSTASVSAGAARSVGAATGNIAPSPVTDSPSVPDPFSSLTITVPTTCTDQGLVVNGGQTGTLAAGVHCGNVIATGSGVLTLGPGEHYFQHCELSATGTGGISGTNVAIILDNGSSLVFSGGATISLEGRESGPFAGFVMISDRSYTNTVSISTTSARELLGTVYLPVAALAVSGTNNTVAQSSAWTVVVAKQIQVSGSANLVINSNYSSSYVPVPSGVGPSGGGVQLTR